MSRQIRSTPLNSEAISPKALLYETIAADLRRRIRTGELAPGSRLPGEDDLGATYGAARGTVRQALGLLRSEGLVRTFQGRKGSVVLDPNVAPLPEDSSRIHTRSRREISTMDAFHTGLEYQGLQGHADLTVERLAAPPYVADRLALADDDEVVVRRRVLWVEGRPSALQDNWFPLALVEGTEIEGEADVGRGTNRILGEMGHEVTTRRDEVRVRMPTPAEAQGLMIAGGVPVLATLRTGFDAEERPVVLYESVLPGDRHFLVYDVQCDT